MTRSINDVHSKLNKSMRKVETGKAYESAAENPLAYYEGKKIDVQYQDTITKLSLMGDVKNRLYEQELGARYIQERLSEASTKISSIRTDSNNDNMNTVDTVKQDLLQKMHYMTNELNGQYQDFYIFGGNDITTSPFSLSADGTEFTFSHKFGEDANATKMVMTLTEQPDGSIKYVYSGTDASGAPMDEDETLDKMLMAMREQGRIDVGYGNINQKDTLLDTYTSGLNVLTGINSDALRNMSDADAKALIADRMTKSSLGLIGQSVMVMDKYMNGGDKESYSDSLGTILDDMAETEHHAIAVYTDLGYKYSTLESMETRLEKTKDLLTEQYKDKLGADPYEATLELYNYQYAYQAAQKLASNMIQSSLFNFMS